MSRIVTFDGVMALDPTLSYAASAELITELTSSEIVYWRCYSTDEGADVDEISARFLKFDAKLAELNVSSAFTRADTPIEVFYLHNEVDDSLIKGGLYANGAVMLSVSPERSVKYVFIDDQLAEQWNYPDTGFILPERG